MSRIDLVVHDAAELVLGPTGEWPATEPGPGVLGTRADGAVAVADGVVAAAGPTDRVTREYPPENAVHAIDASGCAVVPGFVDSHTHAVFAGDRSDEFAAKLRGATYQEILKEGGGIHRTVRATRAASDEELRARLAGRLDRMLAHGSTTVEVKSGYGLDPASELRLLRVVGEVARDHPVRVVPTFMGAHAVPPDTTAAAYTTQVVTEQVPRVADQGVAVFCDVFCEEGVFSVAQARRVLEAGLEHGLAPKVHAEEFTRLGGARLAADLGAVSADHLLHATADDVAALVEAGVVPVFLPGTAFALGAAYADADPYRVAGAPVAVASDFNPNCYAPSMGFAMTLACVGMGFSPAEAFAAVTRGGALALGADRGLGDDVLASPPVPPGTGTLRAGAPGDLLVLEAPSYVHVAYRFAVNTVRTVAVAGSPIRDGGAGVGGGGG